MTPRIGKIILAMMLVFQVVLAQGVYEKGTFVSLPAGKHINHSYYGTWDTFFATEDGVLIYSHHNGEWSNPITASDGLSQYPVLLVWQDEGLQNVWMVTPDYVFVYDRLAQWMSRTPLPAHSNFSGTYDLGYTDTSVVITANRDGLKSSAIYSKSSGLLVKWDKNDLLDVDMGQVKWKFKCEFTTFTCIHSLVFIG